VVEPARCPQASSFVVVIPVTLFLVAGPTRLNPLPLGVLVLLYCPFSHSFSGSPPPTIRQAILSPVLVGRALRMSPRPGLYDRFVLCLHPLLSLLSLFFAASPEASNVFRYSKTGQLYNYLLQSPFPLIGFFFFFVYLGHTPCSSATFRPCMTAPGI